MCIVQWEAVALQLFLSMHGFIIFCSLSINTLWNAKSQQDNKQDCPPLSPVSLSPLSHPHQFFSPILPQALLIFSMADCCFSLCKLSHQRALIAPPHPHHPLRYTWLWQLIPLFSPSSSQIEGVGGKINNSAKWDGVRGQWGPWQVCQGKEGGREGKKVLVCVCASIWVYVMWGVVRETGWPHGRKRQACHGSNLWPLIGAVCVCVLDVDECVCLFGSWWNLTGVRSHHIKPIMDKQANETDESHEMS